MQSCELSCKQAASKLIKINFIDRLVGRTLDEKLRNHCHINCLKNLKIRNIKRGGRWGFRPILGMTEAFSAIFAFISFYTMAVGFKRKIEPKLSSSPMAILYIVQYYVVNAAFLSSCLFHIRETPFSRYADYFTAFATILVGLLVALNRLVLFKRPDIFEEFLGITIRMALAFFIMHVYKMAFHEFDYVYNKIVCGTFFFLTCTCNFTTFLHYREFSHSRQIVYSVGCLLIGGGVEILDISPLFYLFDSHALWHFFMAAATPFYLEFISKDIDHQPKRIIKDKMSTKEKTRIKKKKEMDGSVVSSQIGNSITNSPIGNSITSSLG